MATIRITIFASTLSNDNISLSSCELNTVMSKIPCFLIGSQAFIVQRDRSESDPSDIVVHAVVVIVAV